ncbi:MAG TPA: hypothetical protein VM166_09400, partial [Gemmatimonadaceae bacterium]|nr:hypothetical protein [Gemmatimonadaceae bacterium]
PWSRITMIQASHFDPNTAYASVDRHQLQDFEPYIYRTRDKGSTWQRITTGMPRGVYVHVVKEDPKRQGFLVAGTERAIHVSFDNGDNWQPFNLNMPVTSMRDFEFYQNDLIVATHGRGFWILDDISPLRQINGTTQLEDGFLFTPASVVNIAETTDNGTPLQKDEPQAENPPSGAIIYYYLKQPAKAPVKLDIVDSTGAVVQTFSSEPTAAAPGNSPGSGQTSRNALPRVSPLWQRSPFVLPATAGLHRVVWNAVRPRPRGADPADEGGPLDRLYIGNFAARLTVNGKTQTQPFVLNPDPRIKS